MLTKALNYEQRIIHALLLVVVVSAGLGTVGGGTAARADDRRPGRPQTSGALPVSNTVGLRITASNVDMELRAADFDLTAYTRGYGPNTVTSGGATVANLGSTFFGYPALDFGDGNTVAAATLGLANPGGGPGGSNVYRGLASFSHTYPGPGTFTVRTAMPCVGCFQSSYVVFPAGSPVPNDFSQTIDFRPTNVIGNQPLRLTYAGTTYSPALSASIRFSARVYPVVTNTAQVLLGSVLDVPTTSTWGLFLLGAILIAAGLVHLRRG